MKDDKQQTNDQPDEKPKVDLDLDAVGKTDSATNKPAKYNLDEEPIAVIDTSKYRSGLSVDEWSKLKKQDPASLTPAQKKLMEATDARAKEAIERLAPHIKEMTKIGEMVNKSVGKFDFSSLIPKITPTLPTLPVVEPYRNELLEDTTWMENITPPASSVEQAKQTVLLERMVEVFEGQNAERDADTLRLIEPRYDRKKRVLTFANTPIRLTADSDAEIICKKLFWSGRPVKHPVEKGEIMELLYIRATSNTERKKTLYNKVAAVNRIVEKKTGINKLFDFVDKKLWFNTNYVKLPL